MKINKIDVDKDETTLSFTRHEVLLIRRALQKMSAELTTDEDKWFLIEINGIDDVMKDGNFTRFLSFHRSMIEKESEPKE